MMIVPAVLLAGAALLGLVPGAVPAVERAAARFADHAAYARWILSSGGVAWPHVASSDVEAPDDVYGLLAVGGAFSTAALGLFGRPLRESLPRGVRDPARAFVRRLRYLHSGHVGDYIAWWSAGASVLGAVCLLVLR